MKQSTMLRRVMSSAVACLMFVVAVVGVVPTSNVASAAGGSVSGLVFDDYDVNGVRRTVADTVNNLRVEPGVGGVVVRAFDAAGDLVGTATTNSSGAYSLSVATAATNDLRVEFTVPSGYQSSFAPSGGSTVQFVSLGATNVNLGVHVPSQYCQSNPLVTCTLVDETVGTFGSIRGFNWDNSGAHTSIATNVETGAIWGLAWHPQSRKLFSAPTVRRLAKVYESPEGTPRLGQLFISGTSSATTDPYVDVATLGVDVGTVPNWTTRSAKVGGVIDGFSPNGTWDQTGKVGIGDIDVSPNGDILWFVNLHDRKLYRLDIGDGRITPGSELTSNDVNGFTLPDPGCVNGVHRPWAIGVHDDGSVFVGGVCTAENGGTRAQLEAVVYRFDPATATFGSTPVLRFGLAYSKGNAHVGPSSTSAFANLNNRWYTWWETPNLSSNWWTDRGAMPILSDIEFSSDGAMTLGFIDRMAQRAQSNQTKGLSGLPGRPSVTDWYWSAGGDILRACTADQQTWQIEPLKPTVTSRNCTINGVTYFTGKSHPGQESGEQEFFDDTAVDYYASAEWGIYMGHLEGALGGLATYPRATHVVGTFYDPNGKIFTGGARWFSFADGSHRNLPTSTTGDRDLVAAGTGESFGKAGGLGDIEVLCDAAPLQIGDRLWIDADNDGVQDPGEEPIAGVTVRLYDADGNLVSTAVTDANGQYRFSSTVVEASNGGATPDAFGGNLRAFTAYTIRLDNPDDYLDGSPLGDWGLAKRNVTSSNTDDLDDSIDSDAFNGGGPSWGIDKFPRIEVPELAPGHVDHTFDFGFADQTVTVGDRVYLDVDGDGVQDAGEPGVTGVTLSITNVDGSPVVDLDGNPVTTTTTNANGYYSFDNLPAGSYKVTMTVPGGFTATTPLSDSSTPLILGEEDLTLDFGLSTPVVNVGDRAWTDTDRDGVQDAGEPGIAGVTMSITNADGTQVINALGNPVTTTVTDVNGSYSFPFLSPGQYIVTAATPSGYISTVPGQGDSSTDSSTGSVTSAVLSTNGASDTSLDFGFVKPAVTVGDRVWFDMDRDGVQDAGEPGIAGVTMTITKADGSPVVDIDGNPVTTTVTDANGSYEFSELPPGTYKVSAATPAGYLTTLANRGDPSTDSSTGSATSASLPNNGDSDTTLDFGFYKPAVSVGNFVWSDTDYDGIQDAGEPGIAGVTLSITRADGSAVVDVFGIPVTTTTTDANGQYSFTNLPPGSYKVSVVTPDSYAPTLTGKGTTSTDSSTGTATSTNLTADGATDATLDFGFVPKVSVGDLVWFDINKDGIQDAGEPGIAGVTVKITTSTGGTVKNVFGQTVSTTTTDANGNYSFPDLPPGTYKVTVTKPAGYLESPTGQGTSSTDSSTGNATSVALSTPGAADTSLDFGFHAPIVSVGDFVWFDTDKDGIQESGEPGLARVTVTITKSDGTPAKDVFGNTVTSTTTDANGNYLFENLPTGSYKVSVATPAGMEPTLTGKGTTATDSSTGSATSVNLSVDGASDVNLDFGFWAPPATVGSRVWNDLDGDGLQNAGEPGIPGVELALRNLDGSPVTNVSGQTVVNVITDADGNYLFKDLPFGVAYEVVVVSQLTDWVPSPANVGSDPALDSSTATATSGVMGPALLTDFTLDFGYVPKVSVGNLVWNDLDRDGVQDAGEPGIAGVTVSITKADGSAVTNVFGNPVTTTTTDANGNYLFADLPAGTYKVTVTTPSGMQATEPGSGDSLTDSSTGSATSTALVIGGATDASLDFGFFHPTVSVGNLVWFDTNYNGIQDAGEPGIAGVTVSITKADGSAVTDVLGNPVTVTTTDATGNYVFDNLPLGTYKVSVVTPTGHVATFAGQGSSAVDSSTGSATSATLSNNGDADTTLDFGFWQPSVSVGNLVWNDLDRDGVQDAGEPGIAGVTVSITKADGTAAVDIFGNPVMAMTADANGNYLFADLPIGQYRVSVVTPAGLAPTRTGEGTPNSDSSVGSATSSSLATNGESDTSLDFGFVVPAVTVGDLVWFDTDKDGVQDPGEPGMGNVTLSITKGDGSAVTDVFGNPVTTTTTDANGRYQFANLPLGQYEVSVTNPNGFIPTVAGQGISASDSSVGSEMSSMLVTNDAADETLDFGFYIPVVSVGDLVWFDVDRDGVQDAGEPGIAGVTLTITKADGSTVTDVLGNTLSTTTTDANGNYSFRNIPPGQYTVTVTSPPGFLETVTGSGDPTSDSSSGDATSVILVNGGDDDPTLDFGFYAPIVSVGNRVWVDDDRDGAQDAGEPGLAGVTVTITKADGSAVVDVFGNPVTTAITDANGEYSFKNLPLGQYKVSVTTPSGVVGTTDLEFVSTVLSLDGSSDDTLDFGFARVSAPVAKGSVEETPQAGAPAVTSQPTAAPRTTRTSPGKSVVFCPVCASKPSGGATFVASKTVIAGVSSKSWGNRLRTPQGTWTVESGKVRFMPAPGFSGSATIRYRLTDSSGKSVVSTFTASVVQTAATLPITGSSSGVSLSMLAALFVAAGSVALFVSRRRRISS